MKRNRWISALLGTSLALTMATLALGYAGEVAGSVTVGIPSGTIKCGVPVTVTATILDAQGKPIEGQTVYWTISGGSSKDVVNQNPTVTNANGVATTTVTLACVAGERTVTAKADDISAGAVLAVTAAGLPRTSTLPEGTGIPLPALAALFAVLAGAGIVGRRVLSAPR